MNHIQFIETLIGLGYRFLVYPNNDQIVVEASFDLSCFRNGDEIVPPEKLPRLPYKIFMDHDEEYDDYSILIQWSFEIAEWPAEPPRQ